MIGGSSSINGLVYVRGNPLDFERWEEEGAARLGLSARAALLPAGRDARRRAATPIAAAPGRSHTRYGRIENPLYRAFVEAAKQAGYPATDDVNGDQQEGFGRMDMTVKDGVRWSAANAYLKPAMRRPNLDGAHPRARHPHPVRGHGARSASRYAQGGLEHDVHGRREVILSGGPINSPHLLKLSGVGPADGAAGARHRRSSTTCPASARTCRTISSSTSRSPARSRSRSTPGTGRSARRLVGARWLLRRDGLGATNHFETCGFIRSRPGIRYPDIQYHFLPLAVTYDGKGLASEHGFQAHVGPMRSKSRGFVRLTSADPREHPRIRFNYMSHPDDWTEMRACVRLTREIFAQPAFDPYRGREIQPGAHVGRDEDDRRLHPREGGERLSPLLHLPDGQPRRPDGRGRPRDAGDRPRGPARGRQLDHALDHDRQPQRADDHDRREGRRPHSRAAARRGLERALLRGGELAQRAALSNRNRGPGTPLPGSAVPRPGRPSERFVARGPTLTTRKRNPATLRCQRNPSRPSIVGRYGKGQRGDAPMIETEGLPPDDGEQGRMADRSNGAGDSPAGRSRAGSLVPILRSVLVLFVAVFLMMAASGPLTTAISLRLEGASVPSLMIGIVMSGYYAGLTLGALIVHRLIKRAGHIRTFAAFASILSGTSLVYALHLDPFLWGTLRLVEGFCMAGIFVCIESWLNDSATAETRGNVMAIYMSSLYSGQAAGQLLLTVEDRSGYLLFIIISIILSLSVVPVALTRMAPAPIPEIAALIFRRLYSASPLGSWAPWRADSSSARSSASVPCSHARWAWTSPRRRCS